MGIRAGRSSLFNKGLDTFFLKNRRQSNNFTKDIVVISSYYNLEDKIPSYNVPSQLSKATTLMTRNN